jgi:hypothetical protein
MALIFRKNGHRVSEEEEGAIVEQVWHMMHASVDHLRLLMPVGR